MLFSSLAKLLTEKYPGSSCEVRLDCEISDVTLYDAAKQPAAVDCLCVFTPGQLAGAGIDVFDQEPPLPPETPLLHAKNAVLTPHVAFATEESMLRRAEIVFHNIDAFLAGRPENVCL